MIQLRRDVPLREHTTFKIGGPARYWVDLEDPTVLEGVLDYAQNHQLPVLVHGGGSNMLVSDNGFDGLVLNIANRGIEVIDRQATSVDLRVASGEIWDDVVVYAVEQGFWGLENLSRIPGKMGAFAVQNVGAYGPEAKDVVIQVHVYDLESKQFTTLSNAQCEFSYRRSIFNSSEKGRYIILFTDIRLSLEPVRNVSYPDLKQRFADTPEPDQRMIRAAIREIRDAKFPFPAESVEGNAGSFFKNSVITEEEYLSLLAHIRRNVPGAVERLEQIRHKFPQASGIKIPSAFIMDVCNLKGFTLGNAQLNPTQPVVVLNKTGTATASEILTLVQRVRAIVKEKTGLHLFTEPELIGFTEAELRSFGFIDEEIERYVGSGSTGTTA